MKSKKTALIIGLIAIVVAAAIILIAVCNNINKDDGSKALNGDCQVDFWVDNSLLDVQFVKQGDSVYPKTVPYVPGKVFKGWDVSLGEITDKVSAKAVFETTSDKKNCFAVNSVYCVTGETVTVDLTLCGKINLSTADFRIKYDPEFLILNDAKNTDPSIVINSDKKNGTIYCSMLLDGDVEGDIDCMQLEFQAPDTPQEVCISVEVDDASAFVNKKIVDAKTETISGTVYILGENNGKN